MFFLSKACKSSAALLIGLGVVSVAALADPHDDFHWHGDIHSFHAHDYPYWREGHWYHGDHGGHWGWWWIAAGMWYFYPAPVYPYPDPYTPPPAVVVVTPAPPIASVPPPVPEPVPAQAQNWYYCSSARGYYPYVSTCTEGWKSVPAQPTNEPPR